MNTKSLLWQVPSFPEWLAAHPVPERAASNDIPALIDEYDATYGVALLAYDAAGEPVMPPPAHVLDALVRTWLEVEDEDHHAEPGTVAFVASLPECSACGGRARYDTLLRSGRTPVPGFACVDCMQAYGDPLLGPGHATRLVLLREVADELRVAVRRVAAERAAELWPVTQRRPRVESPKVTASAVAARLRQFWLEEVPDLIGFAESDLADIHHQVRLERMANELRLHTPYDFGEGDPIDGAFGAAFRRRVEALSQGVITSVTWLPITESRRPMRKKSSNLDMYEPGDPPADELLELAHRLGQALPADLADPARALLREVKLVGASRHRLWFATDDDATRTAIGTTPGAAYALNAAVRPLQPGEPLYDVVADPWLARRGFAFVPAG